MFTSARLRLAAAGLIAFTVTPWAQTTSPIDQLPSSRIQATTSLSA